MPFPHRLQNDPRSPRSPRSPRYRRPWLLPPICFALLECSPPGAESDQVAPKNMCQTCQCVNVARMCRSNTTVCEKKIQRSCSWLFNLSASSPFTADTRAPIATTLNRPSTSTLEQQRFLELPDVQCMFTYVYIQYVQLCSAMFSYVTYIH